MMNMKHKKRNTINNAMNMDNIRDMLFRKTNKNI